MPPVRQRTAADELVDGYLERYLALDPAVASFLGEPGHDDELPDLSPDGLAEVSALRRRTLAALADVAPVDDVDDVTVAAAVEQLSGAEAIRATGAEESALNGAASPVQSLRSLFDDMPTDTPDQWASIATRLARMPAAIEGYLASLRRAASRGDVSARRQVEACIEQAENNVGPDGYFARLVRDPAVSHGVLPSSVRNDLAKGAASASGAYAKLATFLREELLDQAPTEDAVGRERYELLLRSFLGTQVDLVETYAWGQDELDRIRALMEHTAQRIKPAASAAEAMAHLNTDPSRRIVGVDAFLGWMQEQADAAISALDGTHFDIPEPLRTLECKIAPFDTGGIGYGAPSDDLARPGRVWYSVPAGVTEFGTWHELSTMYHEGAPGHHLQVGHAIVRRDLLNRWRRTMCATAGHSEGWALYAERLMAELGFLDDPADYLGMLDLQSLRAARVVLDIGIHCGFDAPAEVGGGAWTYDKAWTFLNTHFNEEKQRLRWELNRYLGVPGQAPAYKIGEQHWLRLRDDARRAGPDTFDLVAFHRRALDIGSVGLDVLHRVVVSDGQHPDRRTGPR